MKTNKKEKDFDAVKMMRDIREKLSAETHGMTFEQLKAFIKNRLEQNKSKLIGE